MDATASVKESFHINKLLDYLPIIIFAVIILVGLFTWEVVRIEMASFMMLILVVIYAIWVMNGDTKSYKSWLTDNKYIFPTLGQNPFEGDFDFDFAGGQMQIPKKIVAGIVTAVFIILGIGLGFGSTGLKHLNIDNANAINTVGSTFLFGGIVLILYSLWKIFREDASQDNDDDKTTTKWRGLGGFISTVLGLYMVARAKTIENETKELITDDDKIKYKENTVNAGASTALVIGLVLQVIGYGIIFGAIYCYGQYNINIDRYLILKFLIFAFFFLCGILWIGTSQRWSGLKTGSDAKGNFNSNVFAAHGGIYMIFASVFLVLTLGKLEKATTNYWGGVVLAVLFLGCYIWNMVEMVRQRPEMIDQEKSQILIEEVTKELKKKNGYSDAAIDSETLNKALNKRIQEKQKPSEIINGVFTTLSLVIIVMITLFRTARLRMGLCEEFPEENDLVSNILKYPFIPPNSDALHQDFCANMGSNMPSPTKKTKAYDKIRNGEIDNVSGTEWESLLNTYDPAPPAGGRQKFDKTIVRVAKGAMWNPFLLVILIVVWVAIIFARVSNAESTNVWIARSFTGEMFPKVKELIDTFFIVLIVGLLLCGILLLPFVKELNIGGLESILRFAESIQVWQYTTQNNNNGSRPLSILSIVLGLIFVLGVTGSWYWDYIRRKYVDKLAVPDIPDGWGWAIALVVLFTVCTIPGWYFLGSSYRYNTAFENESLIVKLARLFFTAIYLIPLLFITVFKLVLFGIPAIFSTVFRAKLMEEFNKFKFWNWDANVTDLRLFPTGDKIDPAKVTTMAEPDYNEEAKITITNAAAVAGAQPAAIQAKEAMDAALKKTQETLDQTKVGAIGKLIKVVLLTISFVILILSVIYMVYKVGSDNSTAEQDAASGGIAAQLNSPTAQVIYVIMSIVAIAGVVAYIREKFTKANTKTPEDYLFDDYKPEDTTKPMEQLTFGMVHIIYIVLMIIVWVYDTEPDDKNRMSVTGMTILGLTILFFHYFLEFKDNKKPLEPGAAPGTEPELASFTKLFTNIRFIANTIFFIILCALAYYKQHSVMVVLVIFMFLFHLTKSILGMKFLRLLWLCIIYIPCLFLGLLTNSQSAVGDTTRPIWIILAIETILIAILYGGPYLLNYIGASNSQIIAAPIPLKTQHDTGLTAQSPQIFIFHNTALNRTPDDSAANCPPEEKKRYNYSVSGWFWLNNNVNASKADLEIFNFGGIPRLTYNPTTTEFKVSCKTIDLSNGLPRLDSSNKGVYTDIYNSRFNYSKTQGLSNGDKNKLDILNDFQTDTQLPIQKWNYFVINYDGKSMDVFLNNTLVAKSDFFVPDITTQPITSGSGTAAKPDGLSGNICNVVFNREPLTLEQIRWTYNMLKSQDPPIIGTKTIADEVKTIGSSNVYSQ